MGSKMSLQRVCLLILYCLVLYGVMLSAVPLLDPDEPVYGETAKEMIAFGDWLSPRIYGTFWYDKPPLFYWLEALSFSGFGISTAAARLPSVLAGTLCSVYTYMASRKLIGEQASFFGALILASSLEFIVLARSAVTDMTLTLSLTVALLSFLRKEYVPAYIACGFALLAKGPIGFGFPALIVGLWLLSCKNWRWSSITSLCWYWGIPLACLVGLPWFMYMTALHGNAFIDTFLGYHNLTRFTSPEHEGANHLFLYVIVLLAGFYPWFAAVPGALRWAWKKRKHEAALFFFIWALFIFVFFSLSSTQLFSYILPMFPPLALLCGMYLTEMETRDGSSLFFSLLHILFGVATAAAVGWTPLIPQGGVPVRMTIAACMGVLTFLSAWLIYKRKTSLFVCAQAGLSLLFTLSVWFFFAPAVSSDFTSKSIAEKLAATSMDGPLYIDPFYRPSMAFYGDLYGKPLPPLTRADAEKEKLDRRRHIRLPGETDETEIPGGAYVLMQKKLLPEERKHEFTVIWQQDTAYLLRKETPCD